MAAADQPPFMVPKIPDSRFAPLTVETLRNLCMWKHTSVLSHLDVDELRQTVDGSLSSVAGSFKIAAVQPCVNL